MIDDLIPFLSAFPVLHKRDVIVYLFLLSLDSKLHFSFLLHFKVFFGSVGIQLFFFYFYCGFEIIFIIFQNLVVLRLLFLDGLEDVDFFLRMRLKGMTKDGRTRGRS